MLRKKSNSEGQNKTLYLVILSSKINLINKKENNNLIPVSKRVCNAYLLYKGIISSDIKYKNYLQLIFN